MNSKIQGSNSLPELAARIRSFHLTIRTTLKSALVHAMNTGDLLLEAKAQLDHGQWMPWLREHCEMSGRTARLYMRLAKSREAIEAHDVASLTLNAAARLLASPTKRDEIAELRAYIAAPWDEYKAGVIETKRRLLMAKEFFGEDEFQKLFGRLLECVEEAMLEMDEELEVKG